MPINHLNHIWPSFTCFSCRHVSTNHISASNVKSWLMRNHFLSCNCILVELPVVHQEALEMSRCLRLGHWFTGTRCGFFVTALAATEHRLAAEHWLCSVGPAWLSFLLTHINCWFEHFITYVGYHCVVACVNIGMRFLPCLCILKTMKIWNTYTQK